MILILLISCNSKEATNLPLDENLKSAETYFESNNYKQAFPFYQNSFNYNSNIKNNKRAVFCLLRMAHIQYHFGDFYNSEENATKAIELFDKNIPVDYKSNAYNVLGLNYLALNNFDEALKYYTKTLDLEELEVNKCIAKNNIALVYIEMKEYDKAINLLSSVEQNAVLKDSILDYARVLDNKGFALFLKNEKNNSLPYLKKGLELREQKMDFGQLTSSYVHLAQYFENTQKDSTFYWASKAIFAANKANNPDDKLEALSLLHKASNHLETKDKYHLQYSKTNDSLQKSRQEAKNQFAKLKWDYTVATKEAEIQKTQKIIYFLLFLLTIYGATHLYISIKRRNKIKLQNATYETETRISKRLHDELANDTFNTLTFSQYNNLEEKRNKDFLLHQLEIIYARARNISRENSDIDLSDTYFESLKKMLATFECDNTNIILNTNDIKELKLNKISKIALYRAMQEFMVNMKKHSQATLVLLSFKEQLDFYEINYSDNGIGITNALKFKNGLANVENRIHSSNGSIIFDTESAKGLKIKLTLPKKISYV